MKKKRNLIILLLFCLLIFIQTGCNNEEFFKKINEFQDSINTTTTAINIYFNELNNYEIDLYLQDKLYNQAEEVLTTEKDPNNLKGSISTPLNGYVFKTESIKARTDAIQLIGLYGKHLAELAGSDAPTRFTTSTQDLSSDLASLVKTFGTLVSDPNTANYTTPLGALGTIFGEIGKLILENKRDAALKKAIQEASPKINTIIDLLESDLKEIIGPQRLTGEKEKLSIIINYYNENRNKMSFEDRQKLLIEIRDAQIKYNIAKSFDAEELMNSMKNAHDALVNYAKSNHNLQNFADLINILDDFKNKSQIIMNAVITLHNLKKGETL